MTSTDEHQSAVAVQNYHEADSGYRMHLYPLFLDYRGGTYIAQVEASSPRSSVRKWLRSVPATLGLILDAEECVALQEGFQQDLSLIHVEGVMQAWCASVLIGNELALVQIVTIETAG